MIKRTFIELDNNFIHFNSLQKKKHVFTINFSVRAGKGNKNMSPKAYMHFYFGLFIIISYFILRLWCC